MCLAEMPSLWWGVSLLKTMWEGLCCCCAGWLRGLIGHSWLLNGREKKINERKMEKKLEATWNTPWDSCCPFFTRALGSIPHLKLLRGRAGRVWLDVGVVWMVTGSGLNQGLMVQLSLVDQLWEVSLSRQVGSEDRKRGKHLWSVGDRDWQLFGACRSGQTLSIAHSNLNTGEWQPLLASDYLECWCHFLRCESFQNQNGVTHVNPPNKR